MIPETTRGTFGAFRDPGPTCPQARCESHVIRAPFSATERDSGSVYTYDTPPEKSRVTSRGQFSLTSTNVAIPTILSQRLQGLYGNHMQHLWETMTGQGPQGRGETNALSHPHLPHDQPHPSRPTGTPASSPSVLPTFTNLHATYGYITLPGPHQRPRPRIRTTHAPKSQTTSPKTPQIHSISPKWSALWAHPSPTPPIWRHQQGLRGLPQCPWATEPGRTSETTHRTTRQQPAPPAWRAPEGTDGLAAVPVGGGRAWPDNEPTRRAKLAARTARGRAAAHGHTKQPGSASGRADPHQSPRPHRCGGHRRDRRARAGFEARHRAKRGRLASRAAGPSGARNTRGA